MKNFVIAIDGPAASGKSTTARRVALHFGWIYVDTGAMYRAVTVAVLRGNVAIDDELAVAGIADSCNVAFMVGDGEQRVLLNGEDVTKEIRTGMVNAAVSRISSYAGVRKQMVALQRTFALQGSVVMDGRDIGTVVFPKADVKVFLVASLDERARRRKSELDRAGKSESLESIRDQIEERDRFDAGREHSPLVKAPEAMELDTTRLRIDDQVAMIVSRVEAVINGATQ